MSEQGEGEPQLSLLVESLSTRLAEVLPANLVEVAVERPGAIRLRGVGARAGDTIWLAASGVWGAPAPLQERLLVFLTAAGNHVQRFMSRSGAPWPARAAEPHVAIERDRIAIWWGGAGEADAVVALRPILMRELEEPSGTRLDDG